jgi:crossover junction endodeoxyribonuclease RuvC
MMYPAPLQPFRVVGIDPGTYKCGLATIEVKNQTFSLVQCHTVSLSRRQPLSQRLCALFSAVAQFLQETQPQASAVEAIFHANYPASALTLAHARGIVLLACAQIGLPPAEYPPCQVKRHITRQGHADKLYVAKILEMWLQCNVQHFDDNATDAIAISLCHAQNLTQRALNPA